MSYINTSGYKFKKLTNIQHLRETLKATCLALNLKGTILLSEEGVNIFLSGQRASLDQFYQYLDTLDLKGITFKESPSKEVPFTRMLVKIKKEIITMGVPHISPAEHSAPALLPAQFKQWLDENKSMILLDTRNDYEVQLGGFKNAIHLNISSFRAFPKAVADLPEHYKKLPVVTFCTGGIRAEKAAALMAEQGFEEVYQLEGGILKFFEEYGSAYFEGECFVFDKRVAVDGQLQESKTIQCFACRQPVMPEQQSSPYYKMSEYCPKCYHYGQVEQLTSNIRI